MLDVTYEAIGHLEPGSFARIEPGRGKIRNLLSKRAPLEDVVRDLNVEIAQVMTSGTWYQLWGDEIVGRDTPGAPLRIRYLLEKEDDYLVCVKENKGLVRVHIDPLLDVASFAAAMNQAAKQLLDGGRWFQAHAGEIIDMTPEELTEV